MSPVASRLGAFALLIAGSFGTAYAVGEKLPGHTHAGGHTHSHSGMNMGTPVPAGYENGGYQLVTEGIDTGVATFHLKGADGKPVTDFAEAHGALLHTIIVRPDLSDFNHVHPTIGTDGSWSVEMPAPGPWHVVFDSVPASSSGPIVVSANLDDETPVAMVALPPPNDTVEVDGLIVARTGFNFTYASADGGAATGLEPYLGQPSHLVAIRQGDLAYTHLHPSDGMSGMFMFGGGITEPGTYRLFLQFGHNGKVLTVPFTVVVP